MSDDSKNPLRKPHILIAAAILSAFGGALGTYLFKSGQSAVEGALQGPALSVRVLMPDEFDSALNPATSSLVPLDGPSPAEMPADAIEGYSWYKDTWAWSDVATITHVTRLELRTALSGQVLIRDITPRILVREEPRIGWYIADGACGAFAIRHGSINMDDPAPKVTWRAGFDAEEPEQVFVTSDDTEVVQLHVSTRSHYVEWVLDLSYSAPDGTGTITIDNDGQPFRLSSGIGSQVYTPDWQSKTLRRYPDWDNGIVMC